MRVQVVQVVTWVTIAAAIASAVWLVTYAPQRPFGASRGDSSVEALADASLVVAEPAAAGLAASAPAASQAASF
jgi:hypothetical protein